MHWTLGSRWCVGASLVAACDPSSQGDTRSSADADTSGSTSVSSASASADDDAADGPGSSGVDTATSETTSTSAATTSSADASASSTDASSDTQSTDDVAGTTGDVPDQACVEGCAVEFACQGSCACTSWASEQECIDWCDANLDEAAIFSPFCADAWAGVSACFATLTCEEFAEYHNPTMVPYPCSDEADSLAFECKGQ